MDSTYSPSIFQPSPCPWRGPPDLSGQVRHVILVSRTVKAVYSSSTWVYREVVFARCVILVEDESLRDFLVAVAPKLGCNLNSHSISVVPTGGHGTQVVPLVNIPPVLTLDRWLV